jgi:hypothetical protein
VVTTTQQMIDRDVQIPMLGSQGLKPSKLLLFFVFEIHIGSSALNKKTLERLNCDGS